MKKARQWLPGEGRCETINCSSELRDGLFYVVEAWLDGSLNVSNVLLDGLRVGFAHGRLQYSLGLA